MGKLLKYNTCSSRLYYTKPYVMGAESILRIAAVRPIRLISHKRKYNHSVKTIHLQVHGNLLMGSSIVLTAMKEK